MYRASLPILKPSALKKKSGRKRKRRRLRLNPTKKSLSLLKTLPLKAQISLQIVLEKLPMLASDRYPPILSNVLLLPICPKQVATNLLGRSGRSRHRHPTFKPVLPPRTVPLLDPDLPPFNRHPMLFQPAPVDHNNERSPRFVSTLIKRAIQLPDQRTSVLVPPQQVPAPVVMAKPSLTAR